MRRPVTSRRRRTGRSPVLCTLALYLVVLLSAAPAGADLAETVARVKGAIVAVGTHRPARAEPLAFHGTGFAVEDGRHVVTNLHVVPDAVDSDRGESLAVFFSTGERIEIRRARVVARDPAHDLCLLRISGRPRPTLQVASEARVREGERYAFTGFPVGTVLGITPVTHRGIVSAVTPIVTRLRKDGGPPPSGPQDPYDVYQLDATAYPGNSGSPLYHPHTGSVVGVVNRVRVEDSRESALERPTGISYAIPGRYVVELLRGPRED